MEDLVPPGPPRLHRLFIALPLADAADALAALYDPALRGARWTRPEQLHLTLRFLGDLEETRVPAIEEELAAAVHVDAFPLPLEGVGAFPARGTPHVLWAGTGHAHPHLFQLRQQVDDALLRLALPVDMRTFHAHVTLARLREASAGAVRTWLRQHRDWEGPVVRVGTVQLMRSELHAAGAEHIVQRSLPLARADAR